MADVDVRPLAISAHAKRTRRDAFVEWVGAPLLLVSVDNFTSELSRALEHVYADAGALVEASIAYKTVSQQVGRRLAARPLSFGPEQVRVRLKRTSQFAVPLQKRRASGNAYSQRISVGRARNNDVVLRHESVSKFHAFFGRDDEGAYFISDANSRNGTSLGGSLLDSTNPSKLAPGELLKFGTIEAVYCPADMLWDALRA